MLGTERAIGVKRELDFNTSEEKKSNFYLLHTHLIQQLCLSAAWCCHISEHELKDAKKSRVDLQNMMIPLRGFVFTSDSFHITRSRLYHF